MNDKQIELAHRAFVIDKQLQGLVFVADELNEQHSKASLSMQAVVNCVLAPLSPNSLETRKLVNNNLQYFTWYKMIVNSLCNMQSASQASASSSSLPINNKYEYKRSGDGFLLLLKPSSSIGNNSANKKISIVLELGTTFGENASDADNNMLFLHCECNMKMYLLALTRGKDKQFHAFLNDDDESLLAIVNEESHLYLR